MTSRVVDGELAAAHARQEAAHERREKAEERLVEVESTLGDKLALDTAPGADELDRWRRAKQAVELARLAETTLARRVQELEREKRPPAPRDSRGKVTLRAIVPCFRPTGGLVQPGATFEVEAGDALDLVAVGYAEVAGERPTWWPRGLPLNAGRRPG